MNQLLFTTLFLAQTTEPVGVPAWVPIVIGVILLLLFWWGLSRNSIPQGTAAHGNEDHAHEEHHIHEEVHTHDEHHAHDAHHEAAAETAVPAETAATDVVVATAVNLDNLKLIEGIGPKIEGILHEAGIHTFADLAAASVSQLEKIVRHDGGIQIAYPDTWPAQAKLAADGNWSELEQLQENLKGGRRA